MELETLNGVTREELLSRWDLTDENKPIWKDFEYLCRINALRLYGKEVGFVADNGTRIVNVKGKTYHYEKVLNWIKYGFLGDDNAKCHEGTDGSCDGWVDKRVFNKLGVISEHVDSDGDYCVHCDGLDQWIAGEFLTLHARTEVEIHVGDRVKRTTFNDDGTVKSIVEAVAHHQNQGWWFSEDSLPLYSPEDSNSTTTFEIVEDRKSTRLNSSHSAKSRMPSSA